MKKIVYASCLLLFCLGLVSCDKPSFKAAAVTPIPLETQNIPDVDVDIEDVETDNEETLDDEDDFVLPEEQPLLKEEDSYVDADTTNNRSAKALLTKKETIDYFFKEAYDETAFAEVNFFDSEDFYGYEYTFIIDGEVTNPWRLEFEHLSESGEYYIFRIYERVFYDGTFDHEVTGNFFAVSCQTCEIIEQQVWDADGNYVINDEWPQ